MEGIAMLKKNAKKRTISLKKGKKLEATKPLSLHDHLNTGTHLPGVKINP
jgi:hypothetical protein